MYERAPLIRRAFLRMLPALMFGIVFVGGVYTLLALNDHSWWKPLVYIVAVPLVGGVVNRAWRRLRPRSTDEASIDDAAAGDVPAADAARSTPTSPRR